MEVSSFRMAAHFNKLYLIFNVLLRLYRPATFFLVYIDRISSRIKNFSAIDKSKSLSVSKEFNGFHYLQHHAVNT
jgi:hypothetical protein